jgi:hypothetical protein
MRDALAPFEGGRILVRAAFRRFGQAPQQQQDPQQQEAAQ